MRSIINISLPKEMAKAVEEGARKGHFSTKSEFFRMLVRSWMEGKLALDLEESRRDIRRGKGRVLRSLKDLR